MNAEQKRAWLGLVSGLACVVGYIALLPFVGPNGAAVAFSFFALFGFTPLIGRKQRSDERDRSIVRRAALIGAIASYLAFVLGCMGTWFIAYIWLGHEQISVHVIAQITCLGGVVFISVHSAAVLVLYGRHAEADNA